MNLTRDDPTHLTTRIAMSSPFVFWRLVINHTKNEGWNKREKGRVRKHPDPFFHTDWPRREIPELILKLIYMLYSAGRDLAVRLYIIFKQYLHVDRVYTHTHEYTKEVLRIACGEQIYGIRPKFTWPVQKNLSERSNNFLVIQKKRKR